jgi:hypothetical protein
MDVIIAAAPNGGLLKINSVERSTSFKANKIIKNAQ